MPPIKKARVKKSRVASKRVSDKAKRAANVAASRVGARIPFADIEDPFNERVKKEKGSPDMPVQAVREPKGKF